MKENENKANSRGQISKGVKYPNFNEERKLWERGYKRIVGLDEVGRGCLAAPVVAAAVIVKELRIKNKELRILKEVKDSKKLSAKKREEIFEVLINPPAGGLEIEWGIGKVSEKVIDKINIKNAAELAMLKAVQKLKTSPDFLLIDGKYLKNNKLKNINHKLIIKADEKVFSCAASSIIAKVVRDRMMVGYHKKYPQYGFAQHKGYPTKLHRKMLKKHGSCKIHRKTFRLV